MSDEMGVPTDREVTIPAVQPEGSRDVLKQAGDDPEQTRLTGAVGSLEQKSAAGACRKRDVLENAAATAHAAQAFGDEFHLR